MGRAIAHAKAEVPRFSDPTAMKLLPPEAQARVEKYLAGAASPFDKIYLRSVTALMTARTVEIDDAVRAAACPQLVILGAGLDGRAWRMSELRDVTVFEVDHPDTQRDKKARTTALEPVARDIRFVAVDFSKDDLFAALEAAGHDATRPTMWIWEGVVMYLTREQMESTLAIVDRRSAPKSRISITYHRPALRLRVLSLFLGRFGEPLRSSYLPSELRALLAQRRFTVVRDRDIGTIAGALGTEVARAATHVDHMRIATAERS